ncbi:MAG: oxidoreductase [Pirellulaceae bacterium]|nr:oxidoreductase [Pirellulaceae bacterium]
MRLLIIMLLTSTGLVADEPLWRETSTGSDASLRGVAVARHSTTDRPVVWAAGAKGTVLHSLDQGRQWTRCSPMGHDQLEFRSLFAWNERQAIVASAGTPAIVLKTDNAGQTWREVYRDVHPQAFFDCLKFIDDQRGVLFGDPVEGRFTVLTTSDSGESWQAIDPQRLPKSLEGEAAFAASNSAMTVAATHSIWIGSGGAPRANSRVMMSHDFGQSWLTVDCPLNSGASSGIFSLCYANALKTLVAVGGDYQPDAKSATTGAASHDRGGTFQSLSQPPNGFRSSVVYTQGNKTLAAGFYTTGPTGCDHSISGDKWQPISATGFHALAVLPDGSLAAVGSNGRFGLSK